MPTTTPTHWILDWDSTITTHDTLTPLVHISASSPSRTPSQKQHILQEWNRISKAYVDDFQNTLGKWKDERGESTGTGDGGGGGGLAREKEMLRVLEDVEERSLKRVCEARILAGLKADEVKWGAESVVRSGEVRVRKGFGEFWARLSSLATEREDVSAGGQEKEEDVGLTILSVNWSRLFISSCLASSRPPITFPTASIISNELEGLVSSHSDTTTTANFTTGSILSTYTHHPNAPPLILSSRHKLAIFESLLSTADTSTNKKKRKRVIYIGDSPTDLECLLAADIGICMRDQDGEGEGGGGKLAETLARGGVRCVRLRDLEGEGGDRGAGGGGKVVTWVRDFEEVNVWLDGRRD
ncbi:hypothetical protein DM02DRAFT_527280 [Periconia macrospinosa]|uniref:HAD-like protein n=1 Tax=Periconia macrospinosa TaxID=97972 RepID=A0A2V1DQF6_9PLEO|nr:hypothetical protein DM02DRAFT_527280 [Periconia macrospinosa]